MDIFLIIITIICIIITIIAICNRKKYDSTLEEQNKKIAKENNDLVNQNAILQQKTSALNTFIEELNKRKIELNNDNLLLQKDITNQKAILNNIYDNVKNSQEITDKAYTNYINLLEQKYNEYENEVENNKILLKDSYIKLQEKLMRESDKYKQDLEKIKASRLATIEAARREKEIKEQSTFYCLQVPSTDQADIQKLENIKKTLNNPRVLSMLIWSTFFQKQLKTLSANILGINTVCGIYKITNIITGECYIGQSVDIAKRWSDHAKAGLGIDTPKGNKLYAAMQEYSLWNFSWELLEECPRPQLDEKEKFYIDLYQSAIVGYNSTIGNN